MIISQRPAALIFAAISASALAAAFVAQYVFNLQPCELCLMQRIPYAAVIILGMLALFASPRVMLALIGVCFAAGAIIAGTHIGVEQHWWDLSLSCSVTLDTSDVATLRDQIINGPRARCDEIAWSLFGISMAGYNFVLSLILTSAAFFFAAKKTV